MAFEKSGNLMVAENRYASAAKLALYENKADAAKRFLGKCVEIGKTGNSAYKVAQKKFDKIARSVREYYKEKYATGSA